MYGQKYSINKNFKNNFKQYFEKQVFLQILFIIPSVNYFVFIYYLVYKYDDIFGDDKEKKSHIS